MIARLIELSARNPAVTVLAVVVGLVLGAIALTRTPLDAVPDLSDTQVVVYADWAGRSPDLVEDQVTRPLTSALLGTPGVRSVRGHSTFGLSVAYAIFEDGTDLYWARDRVSERLATLGSRLPIDVEPTLGPDATALGWVLQYVLVDESGTQDLADLRALQDWDVRTALESVTGVAEVASVGGQVEQIHVRVDPDVLVGHDLTLRQVTQALRESNEDAGGRVIEIAGHEHIIRGRGTLRDIPDIEAVPVAVGPETGPILLGDIATVSRGPDMRRGLAMLDDLGEVAGGIVVMRQGQNALTVVDAAKERLDEVAATLPDTVRVEIVYDRTELIDAAVETLSWALFEEIVLVSLLVLFFLLHARSALVVALTMPVAVVLAFVPMVAQGLTANLMSLGGIAVAIGALVDGSIVIVEHVNRRLAAWREEGSGPSRTDVVIAAMKEVGPSIFFSLLVITVSFLPVFGLVATEGRLFRPLAFTKTWAMGFGALLAVTLTPALVVLLVRGRIRREGANPLTALVTRLYAPIVRFAVDHRFLVLAGTALLGVATVPVACSLEGEFMPPLEEGSLLYMPTSPPGMSVTEAGNALQATNRQLVEVPEVRRVFGKVGRADTATDPAPLSMIETTILLAPREEWRPGLTWDGLVAELDAKVRAPGMPNLWWMPIQTRTEMLATGVRSPVAVELSGDDLEDLETAARRVEAVVGKIPGTMSAFADQATGGFFVDVSLDRDRAADHGVRARDVNDVIRAALGGITATELPVGRRRVPVTVRYARELRDDPDELGRALVATPTGAQIPLSDVATIEHSRGPPVIRSEDGRLVTHVFVNPGQVAPSTWVSKAREALGEVELPEGVEVGWTGQFEAWERASRRLWLLVPLTVLVVVVLLYLNTRSVPHTLVVLLAVPFSAIGAVWFLWVLDYDVSVAVWVGLIALAGLDAETGVVMLLYLDLAHRRRAEAGSLSTRDERREAIVEGAAHRIRPKLMTVACLMVGLAPLLWSDGAGADVMKRIAAPMVGGLLTSFALELLVYPAAYSLLQSGSAAIPGGAPAMKPGSVRPGS